jgi:hypothetical protein
MLRAKCWSTVLLVGVWMSPALAQGALTAQFASGGLGVQLNRATAPDKDGNFVVSLIVTNTDSTPVDLFTMRGVQAVSDRGTTYEDVSFGSLPFCVEYEPRGCVAAVDKGVIAPLSIDAKKSAIITLSFAGSAPGGRVCTIDLSLPVHKRDRSAAASDAWRVVAIGLPNIKVC